MTTPPANVTGGVFVDLRRKAEAEFHRRSDERRREEAFNRVIPSEFVQKACLMKRTFVSALAGVALLVLASVAPAAAQDGVAVTCTNGAHIADGVEVIVNMRPGYTYTATAIGIDGFDPVLAVLDASGNGLCDDDVPAAANYSASLPTTGYVPSSTLSSQVSFSPDTIGLSDISLVVGGYNGARGEFVLVLEGMAVTSNDGRGFGAGDPYSVRITSNMIASGVPVSAYMISRDDTLDPYVSVVDEQNNPLMVCDDAGTTSCDGPSSVLSGYYVSQQNGTQLGGYELDAMLNASIGQAQSGQYLNYLMTSYEQDTYGQYVVAFHMAS